MKYFCFTSSKCTVWKLLRSCNSLQKQLLKEQQLHKISLLFPRTVKTGIHRERSAKLNQNAPPTPLPKPRAPPATDNWCSVTSQRLARPASKPAEGGGEAAKERDCWWERHMSPHMIGHVRETLPLQTRGWNESAGGQGEGEEKGRVDSTHPASVSSELHFQEQISPLRLLKKTWLRPWSLHLFCVLTQASLVGIPLDLLLLLFPSSISFSSSLGRHLSGKEDWRQREKPEQALFWRGKLSSSVPEPEAAAARSEGLNSCYPSRTLCHRQSLQNKAIPLSRTSSFRLHAASREPRE